MYRISVDTGGTFTDVVVADSEDRVFMTKALTSVDRAFGAIHEGLTHIAARMGVPVEGVIRDAERINYGTTRSTNLVVTGRTARTALFTTKGFPDTLLLREGGKPGPFMRMDYRPPLIPRFLTFEVDERVRSDGSVHRALDESSVLAAMQRCKDLNVEAVAVALLWSVSNPVHENRIAELLRQELPGVPFTLSHDVNPTMREYRRTSSTAIDASLKPAMQEFFHQLQLDLDNAGFTGSLLVSTSYGGGWSAERISEKPIYSIGSGPSMAPVAAIREAVIESTRSDNGQALLVTDMGGTTFDLSIVQNGRMEQTNEMWLGGKWVGDITGTRAVDVESIGAGGGSIIWVDGGGLLQTGPQSAGSTPGPACYGRGGTLPTITDAALVMGYLDSSNFVGLELSEDLARAALQPVAEQLGMSVEATANAALHISVDNIVTAIRAKTVAKGIDLREVTLVAGGGASGLTVGRIAEEIGAGEVILPKTAGAMSAYGALHSDIVSEFDIVHHDTTARADFRLNPKVVHALEQKCGEFFASIDSNVHPPAREIELSVQARYPMQAWELTIPVGGVEAAHSLDGRALEELFHAEHERVFGVREDDARVELLAVGARARVKNVASDRSVTYDDESTPVTSGSRRCYFGDTGWVDTRIINTTEITALGVIEGPAIIREPTTTIVINPGQRLQARPSTNYVLQTTTAEVRP